MMYMFPRQFGLHNVFTSPVDVSKTAQKFHDYTLREEEITPFFLPKAGEEPVQLPKLPKRLRGGPERLIERLQTRHSRCSYVELLKHYCPCAFDKPARPRKPKSRKEVISSTMRNMPQVNPSATQQHSRNTPEKQTRKVASTQVPDVLDYSALVDLATPTSHVSAFCQAVLSKIIPDQFWGVEEAQKHNKAMVMRKVDHFIKLRRFETVSLHEMLQGVKVTPPFAVSRRTM